MDVHCGSIMVGGICLRNFSPSSLHPLLLLFCTCSIAPLVYVLGAVSLNILRIILLNVAKCEYQHEKMIGLVVWSITNSSDFLSFGIFFFIDATDEYALKEPFDQMKPIIQQANHVLNTVLFPAGVSINFMNVLAVRPNYGNLLH